MKKKTIRSLEALAKEQLVNANELPELKKVVNAFSMSITGHMQDRIDTSAVHDPIAMQFIPSVEELHISSIENYDPIGDEAHTPVKGITHRYQDRCLFKPVLVCPVYCRFCFRKEKVGVSASTLTPTELTQAFAYIQNHPEIWEVIITGGDPFILKPALLKQLITQLTEIPHVEVIRIHTRIPVVDPARITTEMIMAMKCNKPVYVMLHVNHPNEFSKESMHACAQLVDNGIPLLSQTVLLKNINDNIEVMSSLMRCFIKNRIKPHYLHHADLVRGTQHFRTSIQTGQMLMRQLRGRFSGMCQPTYVLDIPGGFGKMPIGPTYLKAEMCPDAPHYLIEDYQGNVHVYPREE